MPELPEVETIVRDLRGLVTGATIRGAAVLRQDLVTGPAAMFEAALRDRRIEGISRRAKNIVVALGAERLVINLGMTGRVLVRPGAEAPPPHLGVVLDLHDERKILYQDVRRFGRLEILPLELWEARSAALGLEPLDAEFTPEALHRLTRGSRVAIKPWLMDQRRVVGIGNIYASEALFRAGLSPRKSARRLTRREAAVLHSTVREVLLEAIDFRGTTLLDFRDATGESGAFARRLRVYDRAGEPCTACGAQVHRIVQGGRSTFFCRRCQR
jgi:formamidopyrimidine-DNA glycosylase